MSTLDAGIAAMNVATELRRARATIAELEKRLRESEKQRCDMADTAILEITKIGKFLTIERQRREEAETCLRIVIKEKVRVSDYMDGINAARAYFRKYDSPH